MTPSPQQQEDDDHLQHDDDEESPLLVLDANGHNNFSIPMNQPHMPLLSLSSSLQPQRQQKDNDHYCCRRHPAKVKLNDYGTSLFVKKRDKRPIEKQQNDNVRDTSKEVFTGATSSKYPRHSDKNRSDGTVCVVNYDQTASGYDSSTKWLSEHDLEQPSEQHDETSSSSENSDESNDMEKERFLKSKSTDLQEISSSSRTRPTSAYFLLFGVIAALSSIGPLLQLQHGPTGTMKLVWRMTGTSIFLFPIAVGEKYHYGIPRLTTYQWIAFIWSAAFYVVACLGFVLALDYTTVGNAVILANSLALIFLVGKLMVGDPVSVLEGGGAIVAFIGAALCSRDSAETHASMTFDGDSSNNSGIFGDLLAISSALGGVGYLITAKTCRDSVPLHMFMFLTMFVGVLMLLGFQIFMLEEIVTFDRHPTHGLWGWLQLDPDRLPLEIVIIVFCNGVGATGYVLAMQYFDNLVISSATLAEPVVAELIAAAFGVGRIPGLQGWLGNVFVAVGTFAVIWEDGRRKRCEKEMD